MLSTLADYTLINNDLTGTLKRTASDPIVARDAQYFRDNINSVTSVDDFVDNYQLFSYAMKAYGLDDMTYAKAFMKKVLESDLSDSKSFANQLNDERYRDIAAAFNFNADGSVKTTTPVAQTSAQEDDTIGLYSQSAQSKLAAVDTETAYYKATIGSVTSVDDFMANSRLVDYALKANGLDTTYYSADTLRKVLTSDLSDPSSFANQLGSQDYLDLAASFNFSTDGSLPAGTPAQSAADITTTTADYSFFVASGPTPQMAQDNTDTFTQAMGSITSVDDLVNNSQLYNYVLTAFGFDPYSTDKSAIRAALVSDPSDPSSYAATATGGDYKGLASFFNFNTDGSVPAGEAALSGSALSSVTSAYLANYDSAEQSSIASATSYFQTASAGITSVDDLLNDSQLYNFVLQAYGLDPDTQSKTIIKSVLESDPSDPSSFVSSLHDPRYSNLAAAFNFAADGTAEPANVAQSTTDKQNTETAYAALATAGTITADQAKTETTYYDATIGTITSVDGFLADSRLVDYALKANGIDPSSVATADLRKALTSDFSDPKSYVNDQADQALRDFAASFNFQTDGSTGKEPVDTVQSRLETTKTTDLYTRQTLETNEGDENTGVRLALYFQRMAPGIKSAYDILADPALLEVVQTALGISPDTGAADIDLQANYITSKVDLTDLQDPDKLNAFISQFASLYDLNNDTTTDPVLSLFTSSSSGPIGISADLMLSVAQMKLGG